MSTSCEPPRPERAVWPPPTFGASSSSLGYLVSPYGKPDVSAIELTVEAMRAVSAVPKDGRNSAQGFNFRGIDGVLNAVGPALRKAGVLPVPQLALLRHEVIEVGVKRTPMDSVYLEMIYLFYGPAADAVVVRVPGSAMDSGDKGVTKAMSVAYRTALIQLFALPTQEPDPDTAVYERAPLLDEQALAARNALLAASTVEQVREIYGEVRDIPGLGSVEVPDALGHPVTLAAFLTARGEELVAAEAAHVQEPAGPAELTPPASSTDDLDPNTRLASHGQLQQLSILLTEAGVSTRERKLHSIAELAGRELTSSGELSMVEARDLIKTLKAAISAGTADALIAELLENPQVMAEAAP